MYKFEKGQWVEYKGKPMLVTDGTSTYGLVALNNDGNAYKSSELKFWEPKEGGTNICYKSQASKWNPTRGEVCIVWDDNILSSPSIIKFDYINDSGQYRATDNTCWDNCMPFTGTLPPHMRESK